MRLEMILAATPRGEIGYNNTIPWKLNGDLQRFKELTMGGTLIMGRNTYESLQGRALKGRCVVVVSRMLVGGHRIAENVQNAKLDPSAVSHRIRKEETGVTLRAEEDFMVYAAAKLDMALRVAANINAKRTFIAGGVALYEWALQSPLVDQVHLTTVYKNSPHGYDAQIRDFSLQQFWRSVDPKPVWELDEATNQLLLSHTYSTYVRV